MPDKRSSCRHPLRRLRGLLCSSLRRLLRGGRGRRRRFIIVVVGHAQDLVEAGLAFKREEHPFLSKRQNALLREALADQMGGGGAVNEPPNDRRVLHHLIDAHPTAKARVVALLASRSLAKGMACFV